MSTLIDVETSIPSFYFDSRRDVEMQACRKWTRLWWSLPKPDTDLVTGFPLLAELNQAPSPKREQASFATWRRSRQSTCVSPITASVYPAKTDTAYS